MKTDDLIKSLSADATTKPMPMRMAWRWARLAAVVLAALSFFAMLGPRPDIADAMQTGRFMFKFVVTLVIVASAWRVAQALSRPDVSARSVLPFLIGAPLLMLVALTVEMMVVPADQWMRLMMGRNNMLCLTFIPLIGLGPLAAFLAAMRHGAPVSPTAAGAVAGVLSGGLAATFYAAHCIDDSPMFVAVWYTLAIGLLALLGAVAARFVVRW